jgi:hypothetical protein
LGNLIYILFITWVVYYADFKMTKHNWGAVWNGIGAIPSVLGGTALAPMQYRVFVPWLCRFFGVDNMDKEGFYNLYMRIRGISIFCAEFAAFIYFSILNINPYMGSALLSLFFIWAALYDYTDVYIELATFATAFCIISNGNTGLIYIALLFVITVIATLNRETAIFIPFTCFLIKGWEIAGIVSAVGFLLPYLYVRWKYGDKERYCKFFMLGENLKLIKSTYKSNMPLLMNEYSHFFVLTIVFAVLYLSHGLMGDLTPINISMGIMYVLLLIPSMWREIRVFTPVMLSLIPIILR